MLAATTITMMISVPMPPPAAPPGIGMPPPPPPPLRAPDRPASPIRLVSSRAFGLNRVGAPDVRDEGDGGHRRRCLVGPYPQLRLSPHDHRPQARSPCRSSPAHGGRQLPG